MKKSLGFIPLRKACARIIALGIMISALPSYSNVIEHCTNSNSLEVECGFPQIEDMAALADSENIIFAEFGGSAQKSGRLGIYSPSNQHYRIVFSDKNTVTEINAPWGEAQCKWPKTISPHGIHLSTREDGRQQLLVVSHGQKEQVLFFELSHDENANEVLSPKGCVDFPKFAHLNDVVALKDDSFAVTHMFQANRPLISQFKALIGYDTGFVYHWDKATGLTALDESDGILPNGIETNEAKDTLYVNMYFGDSVDIYSLKEHKYTNSIKLEQPDNSVWSASGELYIASHQTSFFKILSCFDIEQGSCGGAFDIIALNPETLKTRSIYNNDGGEAFGPATVAVEFMEGSKTKLLMGSFSGDRIARTRHAIQ